MKINEFIEGYQNKHFIVTKVNTGEIEKYLRSVLEIKDYVPFSEKHEMCLAVLNQCCKEQHGLVKVDSVSRYILFTIAVIAKYTNLEFTTNDEVNPLADYDLLCANDVLDDILALISVEYGRCNEILNMVLADKINNTNNIESVFGATSDRLLDKVGEIADALKEKIEDIDFDLSKVDVDKITKFVDVLGGKNK